MNNPPNTATCAACGKLIEASQRMLQRQSSGVYEHANPLDCFNENLAPFTGTLQECYEEVLRRGGIGFPFLVLPNRSFEPILLLHGKACVEYLDGSVLDYRELSGHSQASDWNGPSQWKLLDWFEEPSAAPNVEQACTCTSLLRGHANDCAFALTRRQA